MLLVPREQKTVQSVFNVLAAAWKCSRKTDTLSVQKQTKLSGEIQHLAALFLPPTPNAQLQ